MPITKTVLRFNLEEQFVPWISFNFSETLLICQSIKNGPSILGSFLIFCLPFLLPIQFVENCLCSKHTANIYSKNVHREWSPKFETGPNIIIGIVQKVLGGPSCSFVKMMYSYRNHFGTRTAWSLSYFLNYAYYDI